MVALEDKIAVRASNSFVSKYEYPDDLIQILLRKIECLESSLEGEGIDPEHIYKIGKDYIWSK